MAKAIFERGTKPLYRVWDGNRLMLKRCSTCHKHKPPHEFSKASRPSDGLVSRCKACYRDNDLARRSKEGFRQRKRETDRAYRTRLSMRSIEEIADDRLRLRPKGLKTCRAGHAGLVTDFAANRRSPDGLMDLCRDHDNLRLLKIALPRWEELDLWRCVYCDAAFEEVEHSIPLAQGGTDDPNNLVPSCVNCNRGPGGKHNQTPGQWRPEQHAEMWAVCNR